MNLLQLYLERKSTLIVMVIEYGLCDASCIPACDRKVANRLPFQSTTTETLTILHSFRLL
jgi:hypothetical protein